MNIEDYSADELTALEEQTNTIAANLKYIEEHEIYQGEDLEALERRLDNITSSLKYIEDHEAPRRSPRTLIP
jgi:hypothetical protein